MEAPNAGAVGDRNVPKIGIFGKMNSSSFWLLRPERNAPILSTD
jgi:hypothetical protein